MHCFRRSLLPFFLVSLLYPYTSPCQNFIAQYCTDISFYFPSVKCIQLIPNQFDSSISYSVRNYLVVKAAECFNIQSYESPSSILFSNECREQCPEQYCLLFDNQSNTSIINIFFSQSTTYKLTNAETNDNHSSFDYFLFDQCSSSNRANDILLIVVYLLCGIVVLLTILVIVKYILSCIFKRQKHGEDDCYNWRWIIDVLCCRVLEDNPSPNRNGRNASDLEIGETNNQPNTNSRSPGGFRKNPDAILDPSTLSSNVFVSSSNNTQEPRSHISDTSGSSSDPRHRRFPPGNVILAQPNSINAFYVGVDGPEDVREKSEDNDSVFTIEKTRGPSLHQRLSAKASAILSAVPSLNERNSLQAKESLGIIYTRF